MLLNYGVGEDSWVFWKEIQPVHPKGNQSWIFIERTDVEAETPILWPPDVKNWLIGKDPDAGKDWRQEEKVMTEDEVAGWHHQIDGHEFEQAPGVDHGQGSLPCCSPSVHKELGTTEQLNITEFLEIRNWNKTKPPHIQIQNNYSKYSKKNAGKHFTLNVVINTLWENHLFCYIVNKRKIWENETKLLSSYKWLILQKPLKCLKGVFKSRTSTGIWKCPIKKG